jgi:hypothetical protein
MTVTGESIAHLPEPVRRALYHAGVVGLPVPSTVSVIQEGRIRQAVDRGWISFSAVEEYDVATPGFVWNAALKKAGMPLGRVTDSLHDGHGRMLVRLLGMFTAVDATGVEIDQGSLMRWLNETMWFPAVWATDTISWDVGDTDTAVGSVQVGDSTARAEFRFDHVGRLVDFYGDRHRAVGTRFEMTAWSTPIGEHRQFNGVELPARGSAVWHLDSGPFEYIQIHATDVAYSG